MQFLIENIQKKEDLVGNPVLARASDRSLQIIGDAAKKVPESIKKQYGNIPWKEMMGMRDVIVHEYDDVDIEQVWKTISEDIPKALENIETMMRDHQ